jgi:hypothetical protein
MPRLSVRARLDEIRARTGEVVPGSGWEQYQLELAKAGWWLNAT